MATQLAPAEPGADFIPDNDTDPRDLVAEAKAHGWVPKEEFRGDPNRWTDAETFIKRADEVMPLLKKQNETLKRELSDIKRSARRMEDHFTKAEERIRAELVTKMEKAVEIGDVAGFRKLQGEADALGSKGPDKQQEAIRAFADFRDENEWYDLGGLASATETERKQRAYFDRMVETNMDKAKDMAPADFIAHIGGLVEAKYPSSAQRAPRAKPPSDVAGVTPRAARSAGKTYADLPPEAQRACDKWVKQGLIKDRAAYVASYDFGGN